MYKGLEALKQNKYLVIIPDNNMLKYNNNEEIIKNELIHLQELGGAYKICKNIKDKQDQILQILKNKQVDIFDDIIDSWSYEEYIDNFNQQRKTGYGKTKVLLTEEEYNLLVEALGDE